jgi:hypothetical protein
MWQKLMKRWRRARQQAVLYWKSKALFWAMTLFVTLDCQFRAQKICGRCCVKTSKRTLAALQKADALGSLQTFAADVGLERPLSSACPI